MTKKWKESNQNIKWLFYQLDWKTEIKTITFNVTVNSFENHTSIGKIKVHYKDELSFEFKQFTTNWLLKIIKELPSNKTSVLNDIPMKIIKNSSQVHSSKLTQILNHRVSTETFPDILKYVHVIPVFKKGDVTDKENYRLISRLSNLSKISEKLIYNRIFNSWPPKLPK